MLKVIEHEYIDELYRMLDSSWVNITYDDYLKDPHVFDNELRRFWEFHFRTKKYAAFCSQKTEIRILPIHFIRFLKKHIGSH